MNSSSLCINTSNASLEYAQCLDEIYSDCPDVSICRPQTGANVGLAFGLTIGAGLTTTVGALLPFIPLIKRSNTLFLAIGLSLAAGVMLFVSFTEIWKKSRDNFCCVTRDHYDVAVTACFFGGILITFLLDIFVSTLQKINCSCVRRRTGLYRVVGLCKCCKGVSVREDATVHATKHTLQPLETTSRKGSQEDVSHRQDEITSGIPVLNGDRDSTVWNNTDVSADSASFKKDQLPAANSDVDSTNLNGIHSHSLQQMDATVPITETENQRYSEEEGKRWGNGESTSISVTLEEAETPPEDGIAQEISSSTAGTLTQSNDSSIEPLGPKEFQEVTEGLGKSTKRLHRMGILTGIAIGIHNFPEGLATFVAALSSPSLGAALAVAIALHNIPEGVCVALPVYYATGSKWKGFMWAFLSGISEPFGALLGWLVLKDSFGPLLYGISFGLISGMMVFISLKELLPTALRFDKTKGKMVSVGIVIGMLVMAVSLILFLY